MVQGEVKAVFYIVSCGFSFASHVFLIEIVLHAFFYDYRLVGFISALV